jgi:hypothetical protein
VQVPSEYFQHFTPPEPFLEEISRIVRQRALFWVANIEVIPYFKDWETVPWHMLEDDHKLFLLAPVSAKSSLPISGT